MNPDCYAEDTGFPKEFDAGIDEAGLYQGIRNIRYQDETTNDTTDLTAMATAESEPRKKNTLPAPQELMNTSHGPEPEPEEQRFLLGCKNNNVKYITVSTFRNKLYVDIREFYKSKTDSKLRPTKKGIVLTPREFRALRCNYEKVIKAANAMATKRE